MAGTDTRSAHATIGVLLDAEQQHRWIVDAVQQAVSVPGCQLGPIVTVRGAMPQSAWLAPHRWVDRIVERERLRAHRLFDPVDVAAELGRSAVVCSVDSAPSGWTPSAALAQLLDDAQTDVWLCFTATAPKRGLRSAARLGIWGFEIGSGVSAANAWAGAAEVASGSTVTLTSVVDYTKSAGDGILYRSVGATVVESARGNRLRALHKGLTFFRRLLTGVTEQGRMGERPTTLGVPDDYPDGSPSMVRVATLARRLLVGRALKSLPVRRKQQWQIGYHFAKDGEEGVDFDRLRYIVPPPDRFWADPIAVEYEGRHWVFFEELPYSSKKGRLAAIEVFEDREPGPPTVILERPYHLSYPFVFPWDGQLWMIPETSADKTIQLYRCERCPDRWTLHSVLRDGLHAVDATLWPRGGRWWMFAVVTEPNADACDELHLFSSDSPLGPWLPHRANPLISDVRCARPAGPIFCRGGAWHRPSQDDSRGYGYAVAINRIDAIDGDCYRETIVDRVLPDWRSDIARVHTVGAKGRLRVVDCMVERKRW